MNSTDITQSHLARPGDLAVVLIDVQPQFVESMHGAAEPVLARLEQLLIICEWFQLPVLATLEEPIDRKGQLHDRLQPFLPPTAVTATKQSYAISGEPRIVDALAQLERPRLVVAGSETDVCVMQSVLGLIELGYDVFLLEDCLFSSESHTDPAVARMRQAGAIPCTYKMLFYELLGTDDPLAWQTQQEQATRRGFVAPESLPPTA
mgnify:CR=1 FL=1